MPLDITFTLSDSDLDHFQAIVDKAKSAMESLENASTIEAAARQLIADAKSTDLPSFIGDRLSKLEVVIDMVGDEEWQLSDEGIFPLFAADSKSDPPSGRRGASRTRVRGSGHRAS